jgi:D-3-phosphoglycerate dehydrogenase
VACLKGLLEVHQGPEVNYMSAALLAEDRGLLIDEGHGESTTYHNQLEVTVEGDNDRASLQATVTEEGKQRIVWINGYWIDVVPEGRLLLFSNHDRPGVIGKMGTMLGEARVNIANFALGRKNGSGLALGALQIDHEVPPEAAERFRHDSDVLWAVSVVLPEGL